MVGTRIRLLADSSIEESNSVNVPIRPRLTCQQRQHQRQHHQPQRMKYKATQASSRCYHNSVPTGFPNCIVRFLLLPLQLQQHNRHRWIFLIVAFVVIPFHESWLIVHQQHHQQQRRIPLLDAVIPVDTGSNIINNTTGIAIIPPTSTPIQPPSTVASRAVKTAYIHQNHYDDGLSSLSITIPPYMNDDTIKHNNNNNATMLSHPTRLHSIHVIRNVLSENEVQKCLLLAQQYATMTQCWDVPDTQRHLSYSTCDFPIDACNKLQNYLHTIQFDTRIWNILHTLYHVPYDQMYYLDLFCVQYKAIHIENEVVVDRNDNYQKMKAMDQLPLHRDGSILSFTITLNRPNIDFIDGGTCFDALNNVQMIYNATNTNSDNNNNNNINATLLLNDDETMFHSNGGIIRPQQNGDGIFHCGKLLHGGSKITSGTRIVLVGFVDVLRNDDNDEDVDDGDDNYIDDSITVNDDDDDDDNDKTHQHENNIEIDYSRSSNSKTIVRSNAISNACRDWGRLDVKKYRYERQEQMINKEIMQHNNNHKNDDLNNNINYINHNKNNVENTYNELLQQNQVKYYKRNETSKKWIPINNCFRNICPTLHCIQKYNCTDTGGHDRQKRLQIEDELLRSIFVSSARN
jgi:hypothetical protein